MPRDLPSSVNRAALRNALCHLPADTDDAYAQGAHDLLAALGLLVEDSAGNHTPADEVAQMVISSLCAHVTDGVAAGLAWGDLDRSGLRGVDILREIETWRARLEAPTPARRVTAVQAVIKGRRRNQDVYLMQWDAHAGHYQPIGGKQEPVDASSEAALRRELMEELELKTWPGPDACTLEPLTSAKTITISATYGVLTAYTLIYFTVRDIRFTIKTDADTNWLTRTEIAQGQAVDGRTVSATYREGVGVETLDILPSSIFIK